jgi:hypothetical protein
MSFYDPLCCLDVISWLSRAGLGLGQAASQQVCRISLHHPCKSRTGAQISSQETYATAIDHLSALWRPSLVDVLTFS